MPYSQLYQQNYLLTRDRVESERLNKQHHFLIKLLNGNYIDPFIHKKQIKAIADVGTGTGIWLEAFEKSLVTSSLPRPHLHGFDISAAQFPTDHPIRDPEHRSIPLSVHDILHEWPAQNKRSYDLVHIRLLSTAIKKEQYRVAIKNSRELLKPNGYIQWEELDLKAFYTDQTPAQIPAVVKMCEVVNHAMIMKGLSPFAPNRVFEELSAGGFRSVRRKTYTTKGKKYLHAAAEEWVIGVLRAMLVPCMLITGEAKNESEARSMVDALITEFEKHCKDAIPLINFTVILAQL